MDRLFLRLEKMFERRSEFWVRISTKLISSWEKFKISMYTYHKRKLILLITGVLTVLIWSLDAVTQYIVFRALGVYIPYYYVLGIVSASFIIGALSFLPGGLGAREGSFAYLGAVILVSITTISFSDAKALGAAVALVYKSIVYLIIGIGAGISISTLPPSLKRDKDGKVIKAEKKVKPK
jgi:uncharacterized protein (TIRG00374 family)